MPKRECSISGCQGPATRRGWCSNHYNRWMNHRRSAWWLAVAVAQRATRFNGLSITEITRARSALIWPFGKMTHGYGQTYLEGRPYRANRLMCILAHGEPSPPSLQAAHSCGVRLCVNPKHLRWATRVENAADTLIHGTHGRGERSGTAKLTEGQVREIRALKLPHREIAETFNVSRQLVGLIQQGKRWGWLESAGSTP